MIIWCNPCKNSCTRTIVSSSFILYPINVNKFFQIFTIDIFIRLNMLINLFSEPFLNSFIFRNIINHHFSKMTCSLCSSGKKCAKLFNQFIKVIILSLFFLVLFPFRAQVRRIKTFLQYQSFKNILILLIWTSFL